MRNNFINNKLHLRVQHKILSLINKEDVYLEYRFPGHIGDIYWKSKNIVFEIQCSPISLSEALKRTKDFENLGINIVWILHQKNFNKSYMSPSEEYLVKNKTVYYTNISQHGEGIIFDQEQAISFHLRKIKSPPIEIDITNIYNKKFQKKIYFSKSIASMLLIQRIWLFRSIWKEKVKIYFDIFLRRYHYFYKYLKWKSQIIN